MITDRETDLRNDAAKGLDLSPGNEVSAWAVEEIDRLRIDLEDYRKASEDRGVEIARLKDENEVLREALSRYVNATDWTPDLEEQAINALVYGENKQMSQPGTQ